MLDLVSKHGDNTAIPTLDPPTLLANTEAHDPTVDTGPQSTVVAPRVLPLPATQSSTPAPLTREDTRGEATDPPVDGSSKRLKLDSLPRFDLPHRTVGWCGLTLLSNG